MIEGILGEPIPETAPRLVTIPDGMGGRRSALYTVHDGMVTLHTPSGPMTTQADESQSATVARVLLREWIGARKG